jgi:hypothetical protein
MHIPSVFETWSHRWFGYWKEMGELYDLCPSILDFIDPSWDAEIRDKVLEYLLSAPAICATSRIAFPCVIHGSYCLEEHGEAGGLNYRTDGWLDWCPDLYHYIRHHAVRIPNIMVAHMASREFQPPDQAEIDIYSVGRYLEIPPLLEGRSSAFRILDPKVEVDVGYHRDAAHSAFRAKDYATASKQFNRIRDKLSSSEEAKLSYCEKHRSA